MVFHVFLYFYALDTFYEDTYIADYIDIIFSLLNFGSFVSNYVSILNPLYFYAYFLNGESSYLLYGTSSYFFSFKFD